MFKKTLFLVTAFLTSGIAQADLKTDLSAYYSFEDCAATDKSGNNNNGIINGKLSCTKGMSGKALQFDGSSYINVPSSVSLNPTNQLTMSAWIRIDGFTNEWSAIIHKGDVQTAGQTNREYALWVQKSTSLLYSTSAGDGNIQNALTSNTITRGKWFHYVGVIDRKSHTMSIYINGKLDTSKADSYSTFNNNDFDLRIGSTAETDASFSPFNGALDEIRFYNRALSASEVTDLYNADMSVGGTLSGVGKHTVTCQNISNKQAKTITIPATTATIYDCEAAGLVAKSKDNVVITIRGTVQ
ncbi:MAG: LamG domain-containing protein [Methylococcales bacterium]|nr:LamG domain-containing protein [Methylococcales bacterium]